MIKSMEMNKLRDLINKNPWFARYYDFEELNIIGLRDNKEREKIYSRYDFSSKKIIDVGCNLGKNFIFLNKHNPKRLVGVDLEYTINVAKKLKEFYNLKNVDFYNTNLNNKNRYKDLKNKSGIDKFDYSLYVSVYGTKELKNRDGILKDLIKHTKEIIFFEGHHLENHEKYAKILLRNGVKSFCFEGYLRDKQNDNKSNIRPFFTINNKEISIENIIEKINEIKVKKGRIIIGIEGLAGSGKSALTKELAEKLRLTEDSLIIDDLKGNDGKIYSPTNTFFKLLKYKIILYIKKILRIKKRASSINHVLYNKKYDTIIIADYRLREYINSTDLLISLEIDEVKREKRLINRNDNINSFSKREIKSKNFTTDNIFRLNGK